MLITWTRSWKSPGQLASTSCSHSSRGNQMSALIKAPSSCLETHRPQSGSFFPHLQGVPSVRLRGRLSHRQPMRLRCPLVVSATLPTVSEGSETKSAKSLVAQRQPADGKRGHPFSRTLESLHSHMMRLPVLVPQHSGFDHISPIWFHVQTRLCHCVEATKRVGDCIKSINAWSEFKAFRTVRAAHSL